MEDRIRHTIEHTEIIRAPHQTIATFGLTVVHYYLLTEPVYTDILPSQRETVIREGRVKSERPKIVTPYYLGQLFQGFEHGEEYAKFLAQSYGSHHPSLLYCYQNELTGVDITSTPWEEVAQAIDERSGQENLITIIKGVDELWDVSLIKFIQEFTLNSSLQNIRDFEARRLFEVDKMGIPRQARMEIEDLFLKVSKREVEPHILYAELRRWGVFPEYEDKFWDLFRH
jgi:hypothetical protein